MSLHSKKGLFNIVNTRLLIIYLLPLFASTVFCQNIHFKNLNREAGLTNNFINVIYQDDFGYMWFGTENGLNRYDGKVVKNYQHIINDDSSINSDYITDMLFTSKGQMLIANSWGINQFNYSTERFTKVDSFNSNSIDFMLEDQSHYIWVATNNRILIKIDGNLKRVDDFSFVEILDKRFDVTPSDIRIHKYDKDNILCYVNNKGFYLFELKTHKFKLLSDELMPDNVQINSLLKIDANEFWVGTSNGVLVYQGGEIVKHFTSQGDDKELNNPYIRDIVKRRENEIWILTDGGGINVYNRKTKAFSYVKQNARDDYSIGSNFLYSSYMTKDSTLWLGTVKNGVSQLVKNNPFVTYKLRDLKEGIRSDYPVSSLFKDSNGHIWVGSDGNGLYEFQSDGVEYVYTDEKVKTIPSINELSSGRLILGTFKEGVYSYDIKNKEVTNQYNIDNSINRQARIHTIGKDSDNNIFIGADLSTIVKGNSLNNKKILSTSNFSLPISIRSFCKGEPGTSIIGSYGSLFKYVKEELELIVDLEVNIKAIVKYKDNEYWIGTDNGLGRVNIDTKEINFYGKESGLNDLNVNSLILSNSNEIWMGTKKGVSKFDIKDKEFTNFTYKDGFIDNEFKNNAVVKTNDGKLLFGGLNGILAFRPSDVLSNEGKVQNVTYTSLRVNHKPVDENTEADLYRYIALNDKITLSHNQKVLTIGYSTFEFAYPEKIQYSYKLEGFDTDWKITNDRSLTYMNLDPGTYNLKVKASDTLGVFNDEYNNLKIVVLPAWWQTWWFYLLIVLLISGVVFFVIWDMLRRQIIKSNYEFEKASFKKQLDLDEQQLRFFTNLSHEIRTPLSLIVSPIRTIISRESFNPENAKNLNLIEKNALRIEKLINRGIDFRKTQFKQPELQALNIDLVSFLRDLVDGFSGMAESKNIQVSFESDIAERYVWFDKYMVETIFYNLLSNAFKYSTEGGVIYFLIKDGVDDIEISIQDFGVGISEEDSKHIFDRFFQTKDHKGGSGIGLALAKQFVEAHKGEISLESKKGEGTCFKVLLPHGNEIQGKGVVIDQSDIKKAELEEVEDSEINNDAKLRFRDKSILIVEDEENLRDYLETNLAYHFNVVSAENGKVAYDKVLDSNFDIIVSDVMMPIMDGIELCNLLKGNVKTSGIPFILLTAKIMDSDKIKGFDVGADAYIGKPFHLDLLKAQIDNLLSKKVASKQEFLDDLGLDVSSESLKNSDEKFYTRVMSIIEKHIANSDFDIPLFASEIGMSKSLLYKRMAEISELSLNELILTVRLNKAAKLLVHSKESIVEISNMVGFKNSKYFATSFKKKFDLTPSRYRASKKKK